MKRKTLLLLWMLALGLPWTARAQEELTVYSEASLAQEFVPVYGEALEESEYGYFQCEFIIPASELDAMTGKMISVMSFYLSSPASTSWGNASFNVFLKEVGETVFNANTPSFYGTEGATTVYSGALDATASTMDVFFDCSYSYGGGNLLVGFYQTAYGTGSPASFSSAIAENAAYLGYSGGSEYCTIIPCLPKTTFTYSALPVSCYKPRNLTATVGTTTSTLNWTNGHEETSWQLVYADAPFDPTTVATSSIIDVNTKPYAVSGLTTETTYYAYLRANCGDNHSDWSTVCSFTPSNSLDLTVNNGNNQGSAPINSFLTNYGVSSQFIIPASSLIDVMNGQINKLTFYNTTTTVSWGDATFKVYLGEIEPDEFSGTNMVNWSDMTEVYSGSLSVSEGMMEVLLTTPYNYGTDNLVVGFNQIANGTAGSYSDYWYGSFSNTSNMVLEGTMGNYYSGSTLPKTTISYTPGTPPTCVRPRNLQATVTAETASLAWIKGYDEEAWEISYSTTAGSPANGTIVPATSQSYTLTGLTEGTTYYAYVRANCGGSYSDWSTVCSFVPECHAPENLAVADISATTVELVWNNGGTETSWEISYSTTLGAPEIGTIVPVSTNPYTLTGLTTNSIYYAYIRANCGDGYSEWSSVCSFQPTAAVYLTVYDGNDDCYEVPIYSYMVQYRVAGQYIIPANDLASVAYGQINSLTYYCNTTTLSWGDASFTVYLAEMDVAAFSGALEWTDMTQVFSGSLSVNNGLMVIAFDSPYQYEGGNLVIGINQTVAGTQGGFDSWRGVQTSNEGMALYGTLGSIDSPTMSLPKTTINYTPGLAPSCPRPKNLVASNVGGTTATLTWAKGDDESDWVLQFGTDTSFGTGTFTEVNVNVEPTWDLTGLTSETTYYARVKAICGGDDQSDWSVVCSFIPSVIQTLTVNDGANTNYYIPFYYTTDENNVKSEFIIPEEDLVSMSNRQIIKLTFYTSNNYSSVTWTNAVFDIFISSTSKTEFSDNNDWVSMTNDKLVYSGGLSVNENKMEITLTTPFYYTGGNLLVAFDETALSSEQNFLNWMGVTTSNYPAISFVTYNYRRKFLPKTTFAFTDLSCHAPLDVVANNVAASSAELVWTAGGEETVWQVQYKKESDTDWSATVEVNATPNCTLTGLSSATAYQARVRSACGGDDYSVWKTMEFTTECGAEVPYSYNFDSDAAGSSAAFPSCWTRYNDSQNSSNNYYPYVYSNNSHSSPNSLFFRTFTADDSPNVQMAIMPEVNVDVNSLTLTFWVASNLASTLKIGVMDDPQDITTYTDVATVNIVSNTLSNPKKYTVNLSSYQGTGRYVALRREKGNASISFFVDDINLKQNTPETLPFTYNFDNDATGYNAGAPDGWTFIGNNYPQVYAGNAHSAPNDLCIYHQNDNVQQLVVLPEMDLTTYTMQELQVVFWARVGSATSMRNLLVGVMTDPNDVSTFTTVETVSPGTEYNEFTVSFENYSGTGKYIAIRDFSYNNSNTSFYIDDITVEPIPSCKKPGRPYINSYEIQAHQAFVSWSKGSEEQSLWQFALGTEENFDPDAVTPIEVDVTNEELFNDYGTGCSYYLTGLSAATTYYIYVRANCGTAENPDYSDWCALPRSFTTIGCDIPSQLSMLDYTATTAWLSWSTGSGLEDDYTLAYSENEYFDPDDSEQCEYVAGITETGYTLEGLTAETTYYARVRSNCGADGYSDWSDQLEFMPSAIHSMTVYDQWKIQNRAPLPLDYVDYNPNQDQQPMIGQYVLPEIELLDMRFSKIHRLSLFTAGTIDLNSNALFNVYLKEVDEPTMNGFISFDAMTQVYSGIIAIIDGVMTIVFEEPFYYTEGSLMIGFKQLTPGDKIYDAGAWRGIDPHVAACYTNDYWQGTETPSFLPTTRFTYEPYNVPSCTWPIMLKALPMATFAKLSWSFGSGECDLRYKQVSDADWTLVEGVSISTYEPYVLRNLLPSTNYVFQVRKVCGENDYSDWSKSRTFTTRSGNVIVIDPENQYVESFDGAVFPPTNWVTESDSYVSFWHSRETTHEHYLVANSGSYNDAAMYTPELHIDAQGAVLYLKHMHNSSYNGTATYCDIKVSTDHGEHFDNLWGGMDATRVGDWIETRVSLDYYVGQDIVLKFYHFTHPEVSHSWDINEIKIKAFNKVFNGDEGSGNWSDPNMWSSDNGELPTLDDAVLVNSNVTIPEGTVAQAGQIYLNDVENNTEIQGAITIEDGGQLQVNDTVTVTMQTDVNGYGRSGSNWYLIASPVQQSLAPSNHNVNGVLVGSYDLYAFDGSYEGAEWRNYKQHQNAFMFKNGYGYLVANSANVSPSFKGTVLPSNQTKSVDLEFGSTTFGAWTLVGNPFTCDAYFQDGRSFYRMNSEGTALTSASGVIHGMEGVFVEASSGNESVIFTTSAPQPNNNNKGGMLNFSLSKSRGVEADRASIRFDAGQNLGRFEMMANPDKLFITIDGKDYAVVHSEGMGEMPLCFKASENGTFTINVSTEEVDMRYLHLIDNLMGNDVDLLETPCYTFEARHTDYASRFKIVFAKGDAQMEDDFAFICNGNLIINGSGTLQVIDLLGRVLVNRDTHSDSCLPTSDFPKGIYVLRLINGNNVKNQKIVIK